MLIFVQVYKTIDKNLRSSLGFGRTKKKSKEQKKRAKESTKRKLKASEENCS